MTIISASVSSLYGRTITVYSQVYREAAIGIDILSTIVLTTLTCTAILKSAFKNPRQHERIIQLLTKIDEELDWNGTSSLNKKPSYIFFVIIHLFRLSSLAFDVTFSLRTNQALILACYVVEQIMQYYSLIIVVLIHSYATALRARLASANASFSSILQKEIEDTQNEKDSSDHSKKFIVDTWKKVYKMRKIFNATSKLITIFNAIFGWEVLITTVYVCLEMLNAFNFVIIIYLDKHKFLEEHLISQQEVVWYAVLWCSMIMVS